GRAWLPDALRRRPRPGRPAGALHQGAGPGRSLHPRPYAGRAEAAGLTRQAAIRTVLRYGLIAMLSLALAAVLAVATGQVTIPDRLNPWAPMHLEEAPNFLTEYKLARIGGDGPRCRATLQRWNVAFTAVADRDHGGGCAFEDAVQLRGAGASFGGNLVLTC